MRLFKLLISEWANTKYRDMMTLAARRDGGRRRMYYYHLLTRAIYPFTFPVATSAVSLKVAFLNKIAVRSQHQHRLGTCIQDDPDQ